MTRPHCFLILLAGCDVEPVCPPGHINTGDTCEFSEEAVAELVTRFADGELVQINDAVFPDYFSGTERNVWVSPVSLWEGSDLTAADLYREIDPDDPDTSLSHDFPVGTLIVHERVDRMEGHTVQVKLGEDFSDELGRDWWFGKFYDDGSPDEVVCDPCTMCHNDSNRSSTDGLWGVSPELQ